MTTGVAVREQIAKVRGFLEENSGQFARLLPRMIPVDRFLATVLSLTEQNPELLECSKMSFVRCILQCAQLGILPGPRREAYLIPFNNRKKGIKECQLIIGYLGLLNLCRRSGEIAKIEAQIVYDGDEFSYTLGLTPTMLHIPKSSWREEPDARIAFEHMTHTYAFAKLLNGETQFIVLTKKQIEGIRDRFSKAKDSGPWVEHPIQMALKCPLRDLANLLPSSDEKDNGAMVKAVALDKQAEAGVPQTFDIPILKGLDLDDATTGNDTVPTGPRFQDWYGPMAGRPLSEGSDNQLEQYLAACKRNVGANGREGFLEADKQAVADTEAEQGKRTQDGAGKVAAQPQPVGTQQARDAASALPEDFAAWCNEQMEQYHDLYYDVKDKLGIKAGQAVPVAKRKEFVARFTEEKNKK